MFESYHSLGAKEVQETIMMLNLSVAQIELSINEGNHSVNTLVESFTFMNHHIDQIQQAGKNLVERLPESHQEFDLLIAESDELSLRMQEAVIAFQFYDKLSQRLSHVSSGLSALAEIVSHEMKVKNEQEWQEFKESVRKGTSMKEEEELFELLFDQKVAPREAIEIMKVRMRKRVQGENEPHEEEIEFF
jgi:methyl-accepting chemotaxis protein